MMCFCILSFVFFFKQKTAYEMRISDWSSDVCSSDLLGIVAVDVQAQRIEPGEQRDHANGRAPEMQIETLRPQPDPARLEQPGSEIGRASCRERVCQYV